ncbi:MAG: MFS transporter [Burkholderiaceae bacterium]
MHPLTPPNPLKVPALRSFALICGTEAIARGVTLAVYPLTLFRIWGDAVSVSKIYLAVGVFSLISTLTVPIITRYVPRRWLHTIATLLYLLAGCLGITGGKLTALALLCATQATAVGFVCYNANVLDHVRKDQLGRMETMRLVYSGVGWSVGPFLGVWMMQYWQGAPFLVVAIAAITMLSMIWLTGMGSTRLKASKRRTSSNPLRYLGRFLAQPRLVSGWLLTVIRSCGWAVYMVYLGIFAVASGLGDKVGGITASLASTALFFTPLMLHWIQRRTLRQAVRTGFLVSGSLFVAAAIFSPWPWLSIVLLVVAAGYLVLLDICGGLPFLMSVKPSERTEMLAVFSTFRDVANVLTPAAVWLLLQFATLPAVFAVGGLALLAAWMLAGKMHPQLGVPNAQRVRARQSQTTVASS